MKTGKYRFVYHCWEDERSSDAVLWHHTKQNCEIIRSLTKEEADFRMYLVRFLDGLEYVVFTDELTRKLHPTNRRI